MGPRFAQALVGRVREHPLAFLSWLVGVSLEIATLWLLPAVWERSGTDAHRLALGQALGMLGLVFLLPVMWVAPLRFSRNDTAQENTASKGVRRAAFIVWGIVLVVALAQVAAVLSDSLGYAAALGFAVAWLNLVAILGGLVVRSNAVGRQR